MTVLHAKYLEALFRLILDLQTVFDMVDGEIYANKPDEFLKTKLDNTNQTVIRVSKPSHSGYGATGAEINHIQEATAIYQIDVFSRKSDTYANYIRDLLETEYFALVQHEVDNVILYIDVTRIESKDAYWYSGLEANHAVLMLFGSYRYCTACM